MLESDNHYIDPDTGFAKHIDTGHIIGVEQAPPRPTRNNAEWPKWVVPHDSQVVRQKVDDSPDRISTPGWANCHVNRADGVVTVLVANEDEEKLALGEYQKPGTDEGDPEPDEVTKRAVHVEVERVKREQAEAVLRQAAKEQEDLETAEASRRTKERMEREAHEREVAQKLAEQQRARLHEALGAPEVVERHPAPQPTPVPPQPAPVPPRTTPPVSEIKGS